MSNTPEAIIPADAVIDNTASIAQQLQPAIAEAQKICGHSYVSVSVYVNSRSGSSATVYADGARHFAASTISGAMDMLRGYYSDMLARADELEKQAAELRAKAAVNA